MPDRNNTPQNTRQKAPTGAPTPRAPSDEPLINAMFAMGLVSATGRERAQVRA